MWLLLQLGLILKVLIVHFHASPVAQMVKNLLAMQETWVWFLGPSDPLEKGMVTHSSIVAWRFPWAEVPAGLQSIGWERAGHDWVTNAYMYPIFTLQIIDFNLTRGYQLGIILAIPSDRYAVPQGCALRLHVGQISCLHLLAGVQLQLPEGHA